jgi:predicted nucleic acid-binding protein
LLTPDALHLATCRRLQFCLVTADKGLTVVADLLGLDWIAPG